jgi:hypothetical protein
LKARAGPAVGAAGQRRGADGRTTTQADEGALSAAPDRSECAARLSLERRRQDARSRVTPDRSREGSGARCAPADLTTGVKGRDVQQHVPHVRNCVGAPWHPPFFGGVGRGVTSTAGCRACSSSFGASGVRTGVENVNDSERPSRSEGRQSFGSRASQSLLNGEFDPGSGRTLAARLTHASRTRGPSSEGERVANGCVTRERPAHGWGTTGGNSG